MSRQGPERERSVSTAALRYRFLGDHRQFLGLLHERIEPRALAALPSRPIRHQKLAIGFGIIDEWQIENSATQTAPYNPRQTA
jgi:hypothetical protein